MSLFILMKQDKKDSNIFCASEAFGQYLVGNLGRWLLLSVHIQCTVGVPIPNRPISLFDLTCENPMLIQFSTLNPFFLFITSSIPVCKWWWWKNDRDNGKIMCRYLVKFVFLTGGDIDFFGRRAFSFIFYLILSHHFHHHNLLLYSIKVRTRLLHNITHHLTKPPFSSHCPLFFMQSKNFNRNIYTFFSPCCM